MRKFALFLLLAFLPGKVSAATVTLHWTNPTQLARITDCGDSTGSTRIIAANIYRQIGSDLVRLLRTHDYSTAVPLRDSINVPDTPIASYWVRVANAAGESYCDTRGYTVGVPTVSVEQGNELAQSSKLYDVTGRRLHAVDRSGIYFVREGQGRRVIVVTR